MSKRKQKAPTKPATKDPSSNKSIRIPIVDPTTAQYNYELDQQLFSVIRELSAEDAGGQLQALRRLVYEYIRTPEPSTNPESPWSEIQGYCMGRGGQLVGDWRENYLEYRRLGLGHHIRKICEILRAYSKSDAITTLSRYLNHLSNDQLSQCEIDLEKLQKKLQEKCPKKRSPVQQTIEEVLSDCPDLGSKPTKLTQVVNRKLVASEYPPTTYKSVKTILARIRKKS